MSDYRLQLLIDPNDLVIIRAAGQRITLARSVNSDSSPNVIWLSIEPFQSTEVQWTDEYGIYASTTSVTQGASITKVSETPIPAQDGASYSFTAAAVFNGPFPGGVPRGTYQAQNDMPYSAYPVLTFGLMQSALVNRQHAEHKPISAVPVLATQVASLTPSNTVYIWLQSQFGSQTVISKIIGSLTVARFGGGVSEISLKYDPNRGVFAPLPGKGKAQAEHPHIELVTPLLH